MKAAAWADILAAVLIILVNEMIIPFVSAWMDI